jgi:hypothetical protein
MVSDSAIWRVAQLLIRKHGSDAEIVVAKGTDLMLDRGDDEGVLLCVRIRQAIEALRSPLN